MTSEILPSRGPLQKLGGAHPPASHRLRPSPPVPTARQPFSGVTPEVHLTNLRRPRARAFESATLPESLRPPRKSLPPRLTQHKPKQSYAGLPMPSLPGHGAHLCAGVAPRPSVLEDTR